MKKSLILVGLLSIGYAHAQYEEKVGINTEQPSATLNVKSKTGTTVATKNFELENAASKKLVTVLDNGNFGIQAEPLQDAFNIQDKLRFNYWDRANGLGISLASHSQWARGYHFISVDGATSFGGFGGFGPANSLKYFYIGENYTNTITKFDAETGNVGIGINTFTNHPTHRLHIKPNTGLDPVKIEGLQASTVATDKVVVVDATGVLKTVDRNSIGGTQGIAQEVDGVIGNEITNATTGKGLVRVGSGTAQSPYTLGVADGGISTAMLANGAVNTSKLANGAVTADKLGIAGTAGQILTFQGGKWVAANAPAAPAEVDGVIGNEVTNATQNGGLVRAGLGTAQSPYTLGLPTTGVKKGQVMTWTGTAWEAQDSAVSTISEKSIVRNFREDNSSTVTVRDDDYYVYLTGNPIAINMPAATAANKGKVYCLYNAGTQNADLSPQSVGPQQTLSASQVACYISSGASWFNLTGY